MDTDHLRAFDARDALHLNAGSPRAALSAFTRANMSAATVFSAEDDELPDDDPEPEPDPLDTAPAHEALCEGEKARACPFVVAAKYPVKLLLEEIETVAEPKQPPPVEP